MSDKVERLSWIRRVVIMVSAGSFLAWQVPMMDISTKMDATNAGWASLVSLVGFAVWVLALIYLLGPWSRLSRKGDVNAALNDELVRANRQRAYTVGYIAMMMGAVSMFALSMFEIVRGTEAAHIILVIGVVAPMFTFAALERG